MIAGAAPKRPDHFPTAHQLATGLPTVPIGADEALTLLYERAGEVLSAGGSVKWSRKEGGPPFNVWGAWKATFEKAYLDRCVFCQGDLSRQYGDVEHYYPKAEVRYVPPPPPALVGMPPVEPVVMDGKRVRRWKTERVAAPGAERGFWWLAYDWDNWIYACEACNRSWKKNFFPIAEAQWPAFAPGMAITPLLLHPSRGPDPEEHLEFDTAGQIRARNQSPYGQATIDTCGLDAPPLLQSRAPLAKRVYERCQGIVGEGATDQPLPAVVRLLAKELELDCQPGTPYSGMVRSLIRQHLGVPWQRVTPADLPPTVELLQLVVETEPGLPPSQQLAICGLDDAWGGLLRRIKARHTLPP